MAEEYFIDSGNIRLFPSAFRTGEYSSGKFTSEPNLTGILRSIADKDSFIISWGEPGDNGKTITELVIYGYYFRIVNFAPFGSGNENLWAEIALDSSGRLVTTEGFVTLDDNTIFKGLRISNGTRGSSPDITYKYLDLTDSNGNVKKESFAKFNLYALYTVLSDPEATRADMTPNQEVNVLDIIKNILNNFFKKGVDKIKVSDLYWPNDVDSERFILPVNMGGTGKSNLEEVLVGTARSAAKADLASVSERLGTWKVGNELTPIYLKDGTYGDGYPAAANGQVIPFGQSKGGYKAGSPGQTVMIKTNNGNIEESIKIFYSTGEPGNQASSDGDIWFKYQN